MWGAAAAASQAGEGGEVLLPIATRCFIYIPFVLNQSNGGSKHLDQFSSSASQFYKAS